jgi:hypothetical protein
MFERFTDRARKVMQLANQEAQRFNHEYIGTEHILLGLLREGSGVAATVLKNLDIDLRQVHAEIERIVQSGPDMSVKLQRPQTPRAKKVIEYAIEEARIFNHNYVGTEHLLLGLVREQEAVAGQVLMNLGVKLEDVREEVLNLLGQAPAPKMANKQGGGKELTRQQENKAGWRQLVRERLDEVRGRRGRLGDVEKRLRRLEGRLSTTRFVLGALTGTLAGALLGDRVGAIIGLIAGGLLAGLGRFIPAGLAGGAAGALLGACYLTDVGGGVTGALVGAILAACIVEVGRQPGQSCCRRSVVDKAP